MDGNPSGGPRRRSVTPRAGGRTRRHRKATGMRASERHGSPARTRSGTCRSAAGGSLYPRGVSPSAEVWAAAGRALSQGPIDGDKTAYAWDHSDGRPAGELPSSASEMKRTRRWFIRAAVRGGCCTCGCGCGCGCGCCVASHVLRGKACFCHLPLHDQSACCHAGYIILYFLDG